MKKIIGIIIAILLIMGISLTLKSNTIITFGSEKYYIKTVSDYKEIKDNDPRNNRYEYKIDGYDKNGNEKLIVFTSDKVLKPDRYLMIYVKGDVTKSYEEVEKDKLPDKVKGIYKVD